MHPNGRSKKRNDMEDKIRKILNKYKVLGAKQDLITEELCVLIGVVGSTVYDCDECIKYPCALQEWSSDKNKKLRLGDCGEKVKRNLPVIK